MIILMFLNLVKRGWQFFVLFLKFLYKLAPYFLLLYVFFYTIIVILNIFKFCIYLCLNILYMYFYFYFGFLVVVYFIIIDFITAIFSFLFFLLQSYHSVFSLFFTLIFYFILLKSTLWFFVYVGKLIYNLLNYYVFKHRHSVIKDIWDVVYEEKKVPFLSTNWRQLTTFLRIKHYKATILMLYVIYLPFVLKLIFLEFNPIC